MRQYGIAQVAGSRSVAAAGVGRRVPGRLVLVGMVVWAHPLLAQDFSAVPGSVIAHRASSTDQYLSSPSIAILPDGTYVASHDFFGPGSSEDTSGTTAVYRSTDGGQNWAPASEVQDMHFSSLFVHQDELYLIGTRHKAGDYLIRRSSDGGSTWTTPADASSGLLLSGSYGGTSHNPVVHGGRLWAMTHAQASPKAISAPIDADLLDAASWTLSNHIPRQQSDLEGYPFANFERWTEAQPVASPDFGVAYLPKLFDARYTALIRGNPATGDVSFDRDQDYAFLPGAEKKFGVSYDPETGKFWAATNPVLPEYEDDHPTIGGPTRNTAALFSSEDLRDWSLESVFVHTTDSINEAFQYLNFEIDGDDLAVVSRTAFEDGLGGADSFHDNNLMTFHRVEGFRDLQPTHVLVADTDNDRVVRYQTLEGMPWAPLEDFAEGAYGGTVLDKPFGIAQVENGDVFIGEQKSGGRVLRFDASGNFLEVAATSGADFTGNPEAMTVGPDGAVYLSVAFGPDSDRVYRIDPGSHEIELFIDQTFDGGSRSFDDPRGVAFDAEGDFYVADRDGSDTGGSTQNLVRKFDGQTGDFFENAVVIDKPIALGWDNEAGRVLLSAESPTQLHAVDSSGNLELLVASSADIGLVLDIDRIDGAITWTDFTGGDVKQRGDAGQSEVVVGGLSEPGHLVEVAKPDERTWVSAAGGRWREGQNWNWLWGVANEADEVAVFNGSSDQTIPIELLDETVVGGLRFHASGDHRIAGSVPLELSGSATDKRIVVLGGDQAIATPLRLPADATIELAAGSQLTLGGTVLVSAQRLDVSGAGRLVIEQSLSLNGPNGQGLVIEDGVTLAGDGAVGGNVTNAGGLVTPGDGVGSFLVTGDYTQGLSASLQVEVTGAGNGEFDTLVVEGEAVLAGTLSVLIDDGAGSLIPAADDVFEVLTASGGVSGGFDLFDVPALSGGLFWAVHQQGESVRLLIGSGVLDGDFNGDGVIDGQDFVAWQINPTVGSLADWRANYGAQVIAPNGPESPIAAPEPGALALGLLTAAAHGCLGAPRGIRRRRLRTARDSETHGQRASHAWWVGRPSDP